MTGFALDPRLAADTNLVGELPLCRVLLVNDARFRWLILVPRRTGLAEIADLPADDRARLLEEAVQAGEALRATGEVDKLNIGALGNMVRQLHVHVVARRIGDAAWPGPVWGSGAALPRSSEERQALVAALRQNLLI
jgi:diadenosine tetraphosphate (Ap4A) HIT family hydrolase